MLLRRIFGALLVSCAVAIATQSAPIRPVSAAGASIDFPHTTTTLLPIAMSLSPESRRQM